ncbi:glycine cleavage system protein GcvH [Marinicrinis sediminis]|uniref:Glycine cleavage system H protein n=1 Tax=Marinicrinis sediminis TaxID=1652465 RepID=A0ABW5R8X1_9BACL
MNAPKNLKYSEEHLWIDRQDHTATIGITEFAEHELGEIVFVELPKTGASVKTGEPLGSLESVKTVSELYAPMSGTIVEVNESLLSKPEQINQSPYEAGWLVKIKLDDVTEAEALWNAETYLKTYETE